ncbi:MAG: DUF4105 domain-containing protein, partial [Parvularculaceae bacterium]|nr:DUF4105 domain-containing protein [Parvularculaceae bacterium]
MVGHFRLGHLWAGVLCAWLMGVSALATDLAQHPTWLKLVQYQENALTGTWRSAIVTDSFFLSANGHRRPDLELQATLAALQEPMGDDPDEHALCQYPARAIWLDEEIDLGLPDPFSICPKLGDWSHGGTIDGVSVLFVAGYFSNPGSAFGHILLRLHAGSDELDVEDVLDTAINYGASDSEDDAIVAYIYRGRTGHFRSTYSSLDFYHHSERFREHQLR